MSYSKRLKVPSLPFKAIILAPFLLLGLLSCSEPLSKEAYIESYQEFIAEIEATEEPRTTEFWEKHQETYELLNGEWRAKFADELTFQEEIELTRLQFRYSFLSSLSVTTDMYRAAIGDASALRTQLERYIENDMESDINFVLENAQSAGDAIYAEVSKLVEEIESDLEKQQ